MSFSKRLLEKYEEQARVATRIAVEARVLRRCEFHGEVFENEVDVTPAYKLGNYKFSKGELSDVFSDRTEMTDAIKAAVQNAGMECGRCAKFRDE